MLIKALFREKVDHDINLRKHLDVIIHKNTLVGIKNMLQLSYKFKIFLLYKAQMSN